MEQMHDVMDMLDLFYAIKHMYDRLRKQEEKRNGTDT